MSYETLHIFLIIIELTALLYLIVIAAFTIGFVNLSEPDSTDDETLPSVSVLVAARNEVEHIEQLFESLCLQQYPAYLFEMIFVDDHSDDGTLQKMKQCALKYPEFNIKILEALANGKKAAISQALHEASNKLILVTDADSCQPQRWVASMTKFYHRSHAKMVLGPVVLSPAKNLFQKLQVLEHLSLVGSTAGAASIHIPVMCNGANMAYDREAALQVETSRKDNSVASGDDIFLMEAFVKQYGAQSVHFLLSREAIVESQPSATLRDFFRQRTRWVSKAKKYSYLPMILCALVVALFNFAIISLFISTFFKAEMWILFVLITLLKFFIDFPLLYYTTGFLRQRKLIFWILPLEFIYPFYVAFTALVGLSAKSKWKGRRV